MSLSNEEFYICSAILTSLVGLGASVVDYFDTKREIDSSVTVSLSGMIHRARHEISEMDKKGWFYNNVLMVGPRIAYESFLYHHSQNKEE